MTDLFQNRNKDRRNQPPAETSEVCVFSPGLTEVDLVCRCNHSILTLVGIAQKDPAAQSWVPFQLTWVLPIAANLKRNMWQAGTKSSTIATSILLPHAETGWGKLEVGKLRSMLCAARNCDFLSIKVQPNLIKSGWTDSLVAELYKHFS